MQLGGSLFAALTSMALFSVLIMMGRARGGGGELFMYVVLLGGTGLARSVIHRGAGADLCFATMNPFAGIQRYFAISAANTGAWFFVAVIQAHAPMSMVLPLLIALMAWPTALMVMTRMPSYRELSLSRVPVGDDKGFEGASLLMLAIGVIGLAFSTVMLYMAFKLVSQRGVPGSFVLLLVSAVVLFIRSLLHVAAGARGVRETFVDRVVEAANRYANFGVIAAFVTGGSILLLSMTMAPDPTVMILVGCLTWMLLAWPLAIRRFFSERQFADMMAGTPQSAHVRAPDMGMSSLGWLLFAQALLGLAFTLPALLLGNGDMFGGMGRGGGGGMGMDKIADMMNIFSPQSGHSPWWSVGLAAIELWAGIELLRMSELHRIAATAFGAVYTVVTVYMFWPLLSNLGRFMSEEPMIAVPAIAGIAIQLAIPLVTLFAANRNVLPSATARVTPPGMGGGY
jgi:hypothetical protein